MDIHTWMWYILAVLYCLYICLAMVAGNLLETRLNVQCSIHHFQAKVPRTGCLSEWHSTTVYAVASS